MSSDIKVSVCVVTYNQEKYIAECLQSLVDQVTDFPYEIIVGEDCSTDNTRAIVEEFARKYPDLIVRNYQAKNVGAVQNAITSYRMARGEYICHMDGDDGALPGKIKAIVDAFEISEEIVMVTHDMVVKNSDSVVVDNSLKSHLGGVYDTNHLIRNFPFFTNSAKAVRRFATLNSLHYLHKNAIDVELHLLEAQYGKIYHYNKSYGYYRTLTGVSSAQGKVNDLIVSGYDRVFFSLMKGGYPSVDISTSELKKLYSLAYLNFSYQSLYFGQIDDARRYLLNSLRIKKIYARQLVVALACLMPLFSVKLIRIRSGI